MARLYTCGFELQSVTAGIEFTSSGTNCTISTATFRSGAAAVRVNPSAAFLWFGQVLPSLLATSLYVRTYIYVASAPAVGKTAEVISVYQSVVVARRAGVLLTNGLTLQLIDSNGTQVGSDSAALSLNTWYMVEVRCDFN